MQSRLLPFIFALTAISLPAHAGGIKALWSRFCNLASNGEPSLSTEQRQLAMQVEADLLKIEFPEESTEREVEDFGEFPAAVLVRNLVGASDNFSDALRTMGYQRNLNVLEITSGDPRFAIGMLDPSYVRNSVGDQLIAGPRGNHSPPNVTATIITPFDRVGAYLNGTLKKTGAGQELASGLKIGNVFPFSKNDQLKHYLALQASKKIQVKEGPVLEQIESLIGENKQVDLIFSAGLARIPNRAEVLRLIPKVLSPAGIAYFPLTWWKPRVDWNSGRSDVETITLFDDRIRLPNGDLKSLADYLAQTYPKIYSIAAFSGIQTLIVRSAKQVPQFNISHVTATTENAVLGNPVLQWQL